MNCFKIFSLIALSSLHGHASGVFYKEIAALMLYVFNNNQSLGINTTTLQPQPIFFSTEPELRSCLKRSVALPAWYKENFLTPPYHPNMIVTETAHALAAQEFLPSTLAQTIEQVVHTTVFPDVPYPHEHSTVVSSLTRPLTQAAKKCQITAGQFQQQAKKKKRKP